MKVSILIISLLLVTSLQAQLPAFPIWFEDNSGNKDTIYFGYDTKATIDVDPEFGERNILGEPHDSVFFVFFTDAALKNPDLKAQDGEVKIISPGFMLKKQFVNQVYLPLEIGIVAKNWPITISWPKNQLSGFINNYWNSGYAKYYSFIMTSLHPAGGWFDALSCGVWPEVPYTNMEVKEKLQVLSGSFCKYMAKNLMDTVSVLYISADQTSGESRLNYQDISVSYKEGFVRINVPINNRFSTLYVSISDLLGNKIIINKKLYQATGFFYYPFSGYPKGIYSVSISDSDNRVILVQKIQIIF